MTLACDARPGAEVFLVGDFPDWSARHRMVEEAPGRFTFTLDLPPGLYRYKFLVDGAWVLDPRAAVVDRVEGYGNAVLVVDGAAPPVHFAPDRRHVGRFADGRLVVHLEADEGVTVRARLVAPNGDAPIELRERARRGGRVLLEGRGHASAATTLELDGARFALPPPRASTGAPPSWLRGASFYGIFLDRWRRGSSSGPERRMLGPATPSTPFVFYGGDLDGVRETLPYLEDMGITAIVLTPVALAESPHHYDARDLMVVDPRLGGERALTSLVDEAHRRGVRVVTDFRIKDALVGFVARRTLDARAFVEQLAIASHRAGAFEPAFRLGFLDNHDTARFLSLTDEPRLQIALALLLFMEESAWITYGTEAHLAARRGEVALDASWPERLAMPDPQSVSTETRWILRELCRMRREMTEARAGPVEVRFAHGAKLSLERRTTARSWFVDVDVDERKLRYG